MKAAITLTIFFLHVCWNSDVVVTVEYETDNLWYNIAPLSNKQPIRAMLCYAAPSMLWMLRLVSMATDNGG